MLDPRALAAINAGDLNTSAEGEIEVPNPDEPRIEWTFLHHQVLDNAFSIIEKANSDRSISRVLVIAQTIKSLVEDLCLENYDKKRFSDRNLDVKVLSEDNWPKLTQITAKVMFFVIPPTQSWHDLALRLINHFKAAKQEKEAHLIFIPQGNFMAKYFMKQTGSIDMFKTVWDLNLDLVPLSPDLASLEYKESLKELFYTKEYTCHNMAAESLYRIQAIFGKPQTVLLKGFNAKITFDLLSILEKDNSKTIGSLVNSRKRLIYTRGKSN
jgi:Sec1 family